MNLYAVPFTLALCGALPRPAAACEIALSLAMDVSGSVDAREYRLQVEGVAAALRDPSITDAITQGQVALMVVQWSGAGEQAIGVPWTRPTDAAGVTRLAARVLGMPRAFGGGNTAVGEAIDFAAAQFDLVRDCRRHVIDVSGDGDENEGNTVGAARRRAQARGIAINGLAIEGFAAGLAITNFYRAWVVTPGGFVVTASQHEDFARAMQVKLLRELRAPLARAPATPDETPGETPGTPARWLR